ncbi:MAG: CARDB domain-containing protein, partial [Patescibacteria group bacterium]
MHARHVFNAFSRISYRRVPHLMIVVAVLLIVLGGFFIGQTILAQEAKPDLTISEFFVSPANPRVGEAVTVNANIKNLGEPLTSGQGINNIFRSFQDMDLSNYPLPYIPSGDPTTSNPLDKGGTVQMRVVDGAKFSSAGRKNIYFKVDNADELAELNENNNVWQGEVVVGTADGLFESDGTYELRVGERVKINNGVTVKVKSINSSSIGYKAVLEIFDASGKLVKITDSLTVSIKPYNFDEVGVIISLSALGSRGEETIVEAKFESTSLVPLQISDIKLTDVTSNLARFTWQTNKPTDSFVYFRESDSNSPSWEGQDGLATGHSVMISGLKSDTKYYYYINAKDEFGNTVRSNESSFVTLKETEDPARKPDLIITNISVFTHPDGKKRFAIDYRNTGDDVEVKSLTIQVLDLDTNDDYREGFIVDRVIQGRSSSQFQMSKIIPDKSSYNLKAIIDPFNEIPELNDDNNSLTKKITSPTISGNITGGGHTVDGRIAKIQWRTDGRYNCSIVFKGRSDIADDLLYTGAGISIVNAGEQTSVEVDLNSLTLSNRESALAVYYKVVCRDRSDGHKVAESDVLKIELPASTGTPLPAPQPSEPGSGSVIQNDPDSSTNSEVQALRKRIKRLELRISELEREVVERERQLTARINAALTHRVKGDIFLQVEEHGEAWYVDPVTEQRFYLKDGESAYRALQAFGLGISDANLRKIPVGLEERAERSDSDGDGLDDRLEEAIGTDKNKPDTDGDGFNDGEEIKNAFNPVGTGRLAADANLANSLDGRIVLQVQNRGQAWYIHDGKRYYLKDGDLAYQIMRFLSSGITNSDLRQIGVG